MAIKKNWKLITFLLASLIIFIISLMAYITKPNYNYQTYLDPQVKLQEPEFYGWIAWWNEKDAYALVSENAQSIRVISPVWFSLNDNFSLSELGNVNKELEIANLKSKNVKIYPTLASDLTGIKLSPFLNDEEKMDKFINLLSDRLVNLNADGVDIDLEVILKDDKQGYTSFLTKMARKTKENGLKMSVSIHAQNGKKIWEGTEGQDLEKINTIADEIRIMTYDEHSGTSDPGPISSLEWINSVIEYSLRKIDKEKIVLGIPSYGYIWEENGDVKGLQFNDFNNYLKNKNYQLSRDPDSGELVVKGDDFVGWLSDSRAMTAKINLMRTHGFKKFSIWHLGGMDKKLFSENWSE